MSDFNATFAPRNKCVLLNTGGTFGLCTKAENHHNNSLGRLDKDRRKRARKTRTAGTCEHRSKNVLTSGRDCCR